jgi:hypothetical protein
MRTRAIFDHFSVKPGTAAAAARAATDATRRLAASGTRHDGPRPVSPARGPSAWVVPASAGPRGGVRRHRPTRVEVVPGLRWVDRHRAEQGEDRADEKGFAVAELQGTGRATSSSATATARRSARAWPVLWRALQLCARRGPADYGHSEIPRSLRISSRVQWYSCRNMAIVQPSRLVQITCTHGPASA